MKNVTKITVFFIFIITTFLFLNFYKYYDDIKLPGYNKAIVIENWDKKHNKEEINRLLVKLSSNNNISMIRVNEDYDDNGNTKFLAQYNLKETFKFNQLPFSREKKYQLIEPDNKILDKLNLVGTTFFIKDELPNEFYKVLKEYGVTITDYKFPIHFIIVEYISSYQLLSTMIILLVILFIAILYEQLSSVKEMSIKRIHGYSTRRICCFQIYKTTKFFITQFIFVTLIVTVALYLYNHLAQIGYVFFLFLMFALIFYNILVIILLVSFWLISKQTYHIEKYIKYEGVGNGFQYLPNIIKIIVTLTLLNVISISILNYLEIVDNANSEKYWFKNKDLYIAEITTNEIETDKNHFKHSDQEIINLLNNIPEKNWMLTYHRHYNWEKSGEAYDINNAIYVNKTYLERNDIKIIDRQNIDYSKIIALIPEKGYSQKNINKIKKDIQKEVQFYDEIDNIPNKEKYMDIEAHKIENNDKLFNYSTGVYSKEVFSYNPVLILLPKGYYPISFYSAATSQGLLLFNDYDLIKSKAINNHGDSVIQGLTNAYSSVLKDIKEIKRNLIISVTTSILGIVVISSVYVFIISVYCDKEKKVIFVKTIHGHSFINKHITFIVTSLVSTCVALFIANYFEIITISFTLMFLMILFELLSIVIFINRYEYHLLKDARRGETQ